jgi:EAL domain-containing protein (putative c-di-GMP-specific phosphodiesterase class I)
MMLPEQFIAVAEDCGLIVPIGQWVLREACKQAKKWSDARPTMQISVNISAQEFRSAGFLENIRAILAEFNLAPQQLELELTETALLQDTESSINLLSQLKEIGVRLAIDDFGTGFSSLSYLRQFPIDSLKIDQSFVREAGVGASDGVILNAVIGMGRSLHQRVIAEGIELERQFTFLNSRDCEEGQGFFFSRPLHADQFEILLDYGISTAQGH